MRFRPSKQKSNGGMEWAEALHERHPRLRHCLRLHQASHCQCRVVTAPSPSVSMSRFYFDDLLVSQYIVGADESSGYLLMRRRVTDQSV